MREGVRCCHTCTRCCGKVTVVVETVVKQLYSIRINIAHVWCAGRRLAGHCGDTVKKIKVLMVYSAKRRRQIQKGRETMSENTL